MSDPEPIDLNGTRMRYARARATGDTATMNEVLCEILGLPEGSTPIGQPLPMTAVAHVVLPAPEALATSEFRNPETGRRHVLYADGTELVYPPTPDADGR